MSSHAKKSISDQIEETLIALILGLMTLITFANVIARYVFNSNILWGLEATVFLFAWMVLLGVSYAVKHSLHLGVDILVISLPPRPRKIVTMIAFACCMAYALLLLKGSWDYWAPFIGRRAFLETNDIPMPEFLQFLADIFNEGERYEKIPRFIPYAILPFGMALLVWRLIEAGWRLATGKEHSLIASHEVEEMMEEMKSDSEKA